MFSSRLPLDILNNLYYLKADGNRMKALNMLLYEKVGKRVFCLFKHVLTVLAGVVGKVTRFLGQVIDPRPPSNRNSRDKAKKHKVNGIVSEESKKGEGHKLRAEYLYYEVDVEDLATEYPESQERHRKWVCCILRMYRMSNGW
jgi:hypothetical protein